MESWREKQKDLFKKFIAFADKINKPLVIHARDAYEDCINILEEHRAKNVQLHMFGANHLVKKVIENGWYVSINTILLRSKKHKKVIRDMPIDKILLETDAPWLGPDGGRNEPSNIKIVAEKIAEIKKMDFETVWNMCGANAERFFNLKT